MKGKSFVVAEGLAGRILVNCVSRDSLQTMLADDYGPAFVRFEIFRHEQIAPGKDIGENVENHFVTGNRYWLSGWMREGNRA